MSIALDATLWDEPTTGIALYTQQLYRSLVAAGCEVDRVGGRVSGEAPRHQRARTLWTLHELPILLNRLQPQLFHAVCNFNLPLQRFPGVPFVLTVHDLVPLLLPDTVSLPFRWQFRLWLARALRVAEHIICVSEVTRQSLLAHFDVSPSRISVIHHGVDHLDSVPPPDSTTLAWLDALGLSEPFILYAGALDARKNIQLVLSSVERLHLGGRRTTLVLAGQRWFGSGSIEKRVLELKERGLDIRTLGYLEESVFYALMRRAGVFVFPSRYEGFGLPPLEAMRLGVPTIISDAGALPEICAQGAWTVGVDDVDALAEMLNRLLGSESDRRALSTAGVARATQFSWSVTAQKTLAVYRRII